MGLSDGFGTGKINTDITSTKWNLNGKTGGYDGATQDYQDIWKHIQTKASEGWFIPSRAKWYAFMNELEVTNKNNYGLKGIYWTSTRDWANYIFGVVLRSRDG